MIPLDLLGDSVEMLRPLIGLQAETVGGAVPRSPLSLSGLGGAFEKALPKVLEWAVIGLGGTVVAYLAALVNRERGEERVVRKKLEMLQLLGKVGSDTARDPALQRALARVRSEHPEVLGWIEAAAAEGGADEFPAGGEAERRSGAAAPPALAPPHRRDLLEVFVAFLPSLLLGIAMAMSEATPEEDGLTAFDLRLISGTILAVGLLGAIWLERLVARLVRRQFWQFLLSFLFGTVLALACAFLGGVVAGIIEVTAA